MPRNLFPVDTAVDTSQVKSDKGTVTVKIINGPTIETLGTVQAILCEDYMDIPSVFQLVNRQTAFPCVGI
jgi:hypothetical protein